VPNRRYKTTLAQLGRPQLGKSTSLYAQALHCSVAERAPGHCARRHKCSNVAAVIAASATRRRRGALEPSMSTAATLGACANISTATLVCASFHTGPAWAAVNQIPPLYDQTGDGFWLTEAVGPRAR